jgi:hypothetical protein
MADKITRFGWALGKAVRAMSESARARHAAPAEPLPPAPRQTPATIQLTRCPTCGTYVAADAVCACRKG